LFLKNPNLRKARQSEVLNRYTQAFGHITESEFSLAYGNTMEKRK